MCQRKSDGDRDGFVGRGSGVATFEGGSGGGGEFGGSKFVILFCSWFLYSVSSHFKPQ